MRLLAASLLALFCVEVCGGETVSGRIVGENGNPLEGATVDLASGNATLFVTNGEPEIVHGAVRLATVGVDGTFRFEDAPDEFLLFINHETGFAHIASERFASGGDIVVNPWGRLEGTAYIGSDTAADTKIVASYNSRLTRSSGPEFIYTYSTRTAADGTFSIPKVVGGDLRVARMVEGEDPRRDYDAFAIYVPVLPGETARAILGGDGVRAVSGSISAPPGFGRAIRWPESTAHLLSTEANSPDDWNLMRTKLGEDGSFRFDTVLPGKYTLTLNIEGSRSRNPDGPGAVIGALSRPVTVPSSDEPRRVGTVELGELVFEPRVILENGSLAPELEVRTLDGNVFRLSDYRGQIVLVDFWSTWCPPCVAQLPELKRAYEMYGNHPKFAMIGLSLDESDETLRAFIDEERIRWPQARLEDWTEEATGRRQSLTDTWGVFGIPSTFLIRSDGTVFRSRLSSVVLVKAIETALAQLE